MNETMPQSPEQPIWARPDAFPEAPQGWGWLDVKKKSHPCDSLESLSAAIRDDRDANVTLVWTPGHPQMIVPEELAGMGEALRTAHARWSHDDLDEANRKLRWFGLILIGFSAHAFYRGLILAGQLAAQSGYTPDGWDRLRLATRAMLGSTECGLALLMFIIFAFIPWYQARKQRANLTQWTQEGIAKSVPAIRFETWLERQTAPLTRVLFGLILLVALAQIFGKVKTEGWGTWMALLHNWDGTSAAGLMKDRYREGEWWRLFTAPFLHGNIVHFLMNASALFYLGKRVEVFARWPHLPLVFLFAACVGGQASAFFVPSPSVGASGGLMGWLGFLLVFETLHHRLVPLGARRRLAAGVVLTAVIGLIGYRYVDNAAHAGGLLAGMIYAAIVFPPSASPARPRSTLSDRIAGSAALLVLVAAAAWAVCRILATAGAI